MKMLIDCECTMDIVTGRNKAICTGKDAETGETIKWFSHADYWQIMPPDGYWFWTPEYDEFLKELNQGIVEFAEGDK